MPLTEITKAKKRGAGKDIKTSVPSVPLCETLYASHTILDLTEITEDTEGGRKSVEKPLFETMPLTESTKAKKRGAGKDIKTSVPSVPLCETYCTSHAVLALTETKKDTERGSDKSLKTLCVLRASVRNSEL